MFGLFKKKSGYTDFSFLGVDMHNHLLPGIDDGAKHPDQSRSFIRSLQELGFDTLIATPHVMMDFHPNTPDLIRAAHGLLDIESGIDIKMGYSAEYMLDAGFAGILERGELLPMPGNRILIEMSYAAEAQPLWDTIFNLNLKGYHPILAHPERYNYFHPDYQVYRRFREVGCSLQVNLLSFTGYYGPMVQKVAKRLLKDGLLDFAGTDLHHERHLEALKHLTGLPIMQELARYPFQNQYLR